MSAAEEAETLKMLFRNQYAFLIPKITFTASDFGVFDLLMESREPLTSVTIAERLSISPVGMERLLDACVGLKLLQVERRDNQKLYGNTNLASRYLAKRSLKSQYRTLKFACEYIYPRAQSFADCVREGENQTYTVNDISTKNYFEATCRSESSLQGFMEFMHELWSLYGQDVLNAFDLSHFPLVCDVGGCSGALAKECISLYPQSTVTIFDLPEVVEIGKKHFVSSEEHRITFHEGDFFKDPIPEADLYILARILLCWDDEKCVQLLTKLHKACKPGGGVLVAEMVLSEDKTGPLEAQMFDMLMMLFTKGKERTPSEYNALFSAAGFKEIQLKKGQLYDAILGRKAL